MSAPATFGNFSRWSMSAAVLLLVGGCAQQPKPLYMWDSFPRQLYEYMRGDGSGLVEQLTALERQAGLAQTSGEKLPPGARAHLGLVYLKLGRDSDARRKFEEERSAFPESAPFMDFLLARMGAPKS
jgi:hypothetical protein